MNALAKLSSLEQAYEQSRAEFEQIVYFLDSTEE